MRPQSERHKDALELRIASYQIIGDCDQTTYPLQKKVSSLASHHSQFYPPEFLRTIPHLRPRTNMQGVVTRMRNSIMQSIHSSFQQQGFVQGHVADYHFQRLRRRGRHVLVGDVIILSSAEWPSTNPPNPI